MQMSDVGVDAKWNKLLGRFKAPYMRTLADHKRVPRCKPIYVLKACDATVRSRWTHAQSQSQSIARSMRDRELEYPRFPCRDNLQVCSHSYPKRMAN